MKEKKRKEEVLQLLLEFIAKYWLEVLFGLICSAVALSVKHHVKLARDDKVRHEQDIINSIEKKLDDQQAGMQKQMKECYSDLISVVKEYDEKSVLADEHMHGEIDAIKDGMLSIEGRAFKTDCRKLLEEGHVITVHEYESIVTDHAVYNNLGGNHEGDALFSMVEAKYRKQISASLD